MAYDKTDVAALVDLATGGISYAPLGTPLPTSASATPNVAFKKLGVVGEGGLTPAMEGASKTELRDWSGDIVARVTESQSIGRWTFDLLSIFDDDVANFVFGSANVTATAATGGVGSKLAITETGEEITNCVLLFDMRYEGKRLRIVIPKADPEVTGELAFARSSLSGYSISATALKDSAGKRAYRYYENDDV